jgi:hypothetical protein
MSQGTLEPEEEIPLLRNDNPPRKQTPLPTTQVLVLLLLHLCEPLTSLSINPYINQVQPSIPFTQVIVNVHSSLLVSSQSLVATKKRLDTTQGL